MLSLINHSILKANLEQTVMAVELSNREKITHRIRHYGPEWKDENLKSYSLTQQIHFTASMECD